MRRRKFHRFHHHRPGLWCKIRAILAQILVPLICFQLIRTLLLPTTFDIILLTLMIVMYASIMLRLI
ncbi:hypothetical protein [Halalkalibacter urbisdiaboli]|uniref:hypothetical protein n=1 Tax=Halalkalibacter urbisdiaboli TaxID=1960589 RepID=UPI000B4541D6|nr:hypothetical protein [Halalkalibacter urbisdiaboli]